VFGHSEKGSDPTETDLRRRVRLRHGQAAKRFGADERKRGTKQRAALMAANPASEKHTR
jgi:hypothetical protein